MTQRQVPVLRRVVARVAVEVTFVIQRRRLVCNRYLWLSLCVCTQHIEVIDLQIDSLID